MTEPAATSEILTLKEAAVVLRCSKAHVCNVLNGKVSGVPVIAHLIVGRRKLIRRTSLLRWMETAPGAPPAFRVYDLSNWTEAPSSRRRAETVF